MSDRKKTSLSYKQKIKILVIRSASFMLGRAFQSAAGFDHCLQKEIACWEEGYRIKFRVLPQGPTMLLKKQEGKIRYAGQSDHQADLTINFKNLDSAFLTLTPLKSIHQGFTEHRLNVEGDLARAMSLTRCLNRLILYLYPDFICKKLLKEPPPKDWTLRWGSLHIYLLGLPLGR